MSRGQFSGALGLVVSIPFLVPMQSAAAPPRNVPLIIFAVHGSDHTSVSGMNDSGTIAGIYSVGSFAHSFVRSADGKITRFDPPGAESSEPVGINAAGTIVGIYFDASGEDGFYIRIADGTLATYNYPTKTYGQIAGIDDAGAVAGSTGNAYGQPYGYLRNADGSFKAFQIGGLDGGSRIAGTLVTAVDGSGWLAGSAYGLRTDLRGLGFVRSPDGKIETFGVTANDDVFAFGINRAGTVTGFHAANGAPEPFLRRRDGTITTFNYAWCGITPYAIDSRGEILGGCRKRVKGKPEILAGFLRSPAGKIRVFRVHGLQTSPNGITPSGIVFGSVETKTDKNYAFFGTP